MSHRAVPWIALALPLWVACFQPQVQEGLHCDSDGACPPDQACFDGVCLLGPPAEGAVDAGADAASDTDAPDSPVVDDDADPDLPVDGADAGVDASGPICEDSSCDDGRVCNGREACGADGCETVAAAQVRWEIISGDHAGRTGVDNIGCDVTLTVDTLPDTCGTHLYQCVLGADDTMQARLRGCATLDGPVVSSGCSKLAGFGADIVHCCFVP